MSGILNRMLNKIRKHKDFSKAGMILIHNGIVRKTTRDGKRVKGLKVEVNWDKVNKIIEENKKRKGIIDIIVEIIENKELKVGEDIMYILVAGDIRDNVIPVLEDVLNDIKSKATKKEQYFI